MTEQLNPEHFQPHLTRMFRVQGGRHDLTLNEVKTPALSASELARWPRQPFSLIFSGPPGDVLPEGFYTLEIEGGPEFGLYIVPIQTMARDRQDYQALFN